MRPDPDGVIPEEPSPPERPRRSTDAILYQAVLDEMKRIVPEEPAPIGINFSGGEVDLLDLVVELRRLPSGAGGDSFHRVVLRLLDAGSP